jgi:transcriptional regulator GlxA family with amidase domain
VLPHASAAHAVAQELVLFLRRPGSQSQFSVPLWSPQPSTGPIRAVVSAVHAGPGARLAIGDLAARAGLSPRQLQRRFTAELGVPPGEYVERVRIEAARWPPGMTRWTWSPAGAGSAPPRPCGGRFTVTSMSRDEPLPH